MDSLTRTATLLRVLSVSLAIVVGISLVAADVGDDEFLTTGVPPNHVFDAVQFDRLDLLNGNLHFERLLHRGQVNSGFSYELRLAYNSTVWAWHKDDHEMRLGAKSQVGLGFRLHMGRIYKITNPGGNHDRWFYEDGSGTSHLLRPHSEPGDIEYWWSGDGTLIRAAKLFGLTRFIHERPRGSDREAVNVGFASLIGLGGCSAAGFYRVGVD